MVLNYRHEARRHLQCAKGELSANVDQRLKFAALSLRMAMECLTYDRALAFKDEFPPTEYDTWQPHKVMSVLLEIDPYADKDSSIAVGVESEAGVPATNMQMFGSEKVLNMRMLQKQYHSLGSYLHVKTIKQLRDGAPINYTKMRTQIEEISAFIDDVLASQVFNVTIGNHLTMECSECRKPIRKRLPYGQKEVKAECYECEASYTITAEDNGKVRWKPNQVKAVCAKLNCQGDIILWERKLQAGRWWKCKECQGRNVLCLGVSYIEDTPQGA